MCEYNPREPCEVCGYCEYMEQRIEDEIDAICMSLEFKGYENELRTDNREVERETVERRTA